MTDLNEFAQKDGVDRSNDSDIEVLQSRTSKTVQKLRKRAKEAEFSGGELTK